MTLSKERRKLIQRLRDPRLRSREGLFLVEGVRGVGEFLRGAMTVRPRFALVSPRLSGLADGPGLRGALDAAAVPVEAIEDDELVALSDTEQPQGVLLVMEEPRLAWPPEDGGGSSRFLLLDGIQDPGNVGTLIRAARAFEVNTVVALEGTADPWSPKAVRSGAGAAAHVPVAKVGWTRVRDWLDGQGVPILVAEAGGEDIRTHPVPDRWALVLGNEGAGVRSEIREEARALLAIPMDRAADSLNVAMAGAILLFTLSSPGNRSGTH